MIGVDFNPPSVEQYTQDMNKCAAADQSQSADHRLFARGRRAGARTSPGIPPRWLTRPRAPRNPNGLDVVYWIAPENGAKKAATPHVFHICQGVSPLRGKTVNHGSVTEAYAENATRITKQIPMEQKQCGFAGAKPDKAAAPASGITRRQLGDSRRRRPA